MFKNDFQGGLSVEVFSVQGKDPLSKVKISGPSTAIRKEFDNDLKTFILLIEGEPTRSKITVPKSSKQTLHLTQEYLIFQLYLHAGRQFSLEVSVTDQSNNKQRIILSSSNREIVVTTLHAKMPCSMVQQNIWLNLCLDLNDIIPGVFDGSHFAVIDSIVLSANCKLKRIFTLKSRPVENIDIPKNFQLADECTAVQVLDMNTFLDAGINIRSGTGKSNKRTAPIITKTIDNTHIAFGSRYRNSSILDNKNLESSANSAGSSSNTSRTGKTSNRKDSLGDNSANRNSDSEKSFHQPMPPTQTAGKVRRPRIKSAEYSKNKFNNDLKTQPLSKSADTRNRRKASDTTNDHFRYRKNSMGTDLNLIDQSNFEQEEIFPAVKLKKKISRSAINLEHTEKLISENRDLHFKSKSLNILPKIIKTNNRYKDMNNNQDIENDVFIESASTADEASWNMLGDDAMVEEYLRRRTTSSCQDESSLSITSSCANSTNSDLFIYSSRPRSVTGQRSSRNNDVEMEKIVETSSINIESNSNNEADTAENNQSNHFPSSSSTSFSSKHSLMIETDPNEIVDKFLRKSSDNNEDVNSSDDIASTERNEPSSSILLKDKERNGLVNHVKTSSATDTGSSSTNLKIRITTDNTEVTSTDKLSVGLTESNMKTFNHLHSFQMRDSCDSDTMSWLHASEDHSFSEKNETNQTLDHLKPSPKLTLRRQIEERLGSLIVQSKDADTDDGFSDCSDDTTFVEPPTKFRNFRYQDEIKSIGSTLDLAATIPATPMVGEQARNNYGNSDENNNQPNVQTLKLHQSHNEELLDLLFDPVLNCYYDPVSHKYYELS